MKSKTGIANVAQKPGNYHDLKDLMKSVQDNEAKSNQFSDAEIKTQPSDMVGLHVLVSKELRKKLKLKAIEEGRPVKQLIPAILENYLGA